MLQECAWAKTIIQVGYGKIATCARHPDWAGSVDLGFGDLGLREWAGSDWPKSIAEIFAGVMAYISGQT
ncbi:hypothetical protein CsSME_00049384 [Camellia sinensis var. sinensis]